MSLKFKVGDFVNHKLAWIGRENLVGIKMFVCAVRNEDDYPMGQVVMQIRAREFPVGCRWWNKEMERYDIEWFAVEELELWTE